MTTTPTTGTPRRFFSKARGKSPSLAAAYGVWALSRVQPLRAPAIETTAAQATRVPPQVPPNMALTASVKGASEETSFSWATRPKTERVPSR